MNKKILYGVFLAALSLSACSNVDNNQTLDKKFINQTFLDFTKGEPNIDVITPSDHYSNGGVFGCDWNKDNIYYDENGVNFLLYKDADTYYGSELKTLSVDGLFGAGYFSTVMKPSNVTGTASTFFLYIDDPHDEIDIEFLGKDTTKVQFNYFTNGVGGNEYLYDLGFDASEEFHTYGFYWDISRIIWYVDEVPVYQRNVNIPSHDMRIYMNFWNGNQEDAGITYWMGKIDDDKLPAITSFKGINYADIYGKGRSVPEGKKEEEFDEDKVVSLYDLGFSSNSSYEVEKEEDHYNISFTQKEGQFQYIAPNEYGTLAFGDPQYSYMKVKNLSDFTYDLCLSFYDQNSEYAGLDGSVISELGTSSLRKKGSTCLYYEFGAGDTAIFKSILKPEITKFTKANIMAAPNSDTVGAFAIYDWYIYDNDPVDNSHKEPLTNITLMDHELFGDYTVEKNEDIFNVSFTQIPGTLKDLKVKDISEMTFEKPQYSVIKVKNLSTFAYQFTLTFREVNKNYMTTGGIVLSSENNTSKFVKSGSTAEYFSLGASDTAEFKVSINDSATCFSLIEIIIEPKATEKISGAFQILDWYVAQ